MFNVSDYYYDEYYKDSNVYERDRQQSSDPEDPYCDEDRYYDEYEDYEDDPYIHY